MATFHAIFHRDVLLNRYAPLGLARNPFGSLTPDETAAVAVVDTADILNMLGTPGRAVQIIAPRGRGKTTHLRAIEREHPDAAYVYFPQRFRGLNRHPAVPAADLLILDEAQRIPRCIERKIFATETPLLLGTHWSVAKRLRRFGYEVQTRRLCDHEDSSVTERLVDNRLRLAALGDAEPAIIWTTGDAQRLHQRFAGRHRAMIHYLYQRVERLATEPPRGGTGAGPRKIVFRL